jgi:hypothetical protein
MGIIVETTPNPRAMKFIVGSPVGIAATAMSAEAADDRIAPLFGIEGVMSVFMTADFVTVSATEDASWDAIVPEVIAVLDTAFA